MGVKFIASGGQVMAFLAGVGIGHRLTRNKIKKLGAISEETAKKPEELGVEEWLLKRITESKGLGVKRTSDGRYYVECKDKKHC